MRRTRALAILGVTVVAFLFFAPQVRSALVAPLVFINIAVQEGAWRPLEFLTREPTREEHTITSTSGRILAIDLYVPAGSGRHPAMIIYVPLAGGGQRDTRLVNLAESFAQAGFVVMIPWSDDDQEILNQKDVEDIVSVFSFLLQHDRVDPSRAGLFGISYGNGPIFLAAADERIRDDVSFVASYAGYYDLSEAMRYVVTGQYSYGEIREYLEPEPWVRGLMRDNLLAYGVTEERIDAFFDSPERFDELLAAEPYLMDALQSLSPSGVRDRIRARTIISHSTGDRTIPYTESLKLKDALSGSVPTTLSIVNIFVHGETVPVTARTVLKNYVPSFSAGYAFLYHILMMRSR